MPRGKMEVNRLGKEERNVFKWEKKSNDPVKTRKQWRSKMPVYLREEIIHREREHRLEKAVMQTLCSRKKEEEWSEAVWTREVVTVSEGTGAGLLSLWGPRGRSEVAVGSKGSILGKLQGKFYQLCLGMLRRWAFGWGPSGPGTVCLK